MSALAMSILEDYDHDYDPAETDQAFGDDIDTLNSDLQEIAELEAQIGQTYTVSKLFALRGTTPGAIRMLYASGLLNGVSLSAVATEAYAANDTSVTEAVATEALNASLQQKVTTWATKILTTLKSGAERIVGLVEPIYTRIQDGIAKLGQMAWDKTKTSVAIVKAHPYKTILAVLTAAVAVGGVALYVSGNIPTLGATNGAMKTFMDKLSAMWNGIRLPFGKIRTKVMVDGVTTYADVQSAEMVAAGTDRISALGWTQSTVKAIGNLAASAFTSLFKGLKDMGSRLVAPVRKILAKKAFMPAEIGKFAAKTVDAPIAGWATQKIVELVYGKILFSLVGNVLNMVNKITTVAMQMTRQTIAALRGADLQEA